MRKLILHPLFVFISVWGLVLFLYELKWSDLQSIELSSGRILFFGTLSIFCYVALLFYFATFGRGQHASPTQNRSLFSFDENISFRWFYFWIFFTFLEILYSGGIPIYWAISGSSKTYFDFGLPTVHGFLNALISCLSLIWFYLYQTSKNKKFLYLSLFVILWGVIVITRQLIIVNLFQFLVIWLATNRVRFLSFIKIFFIVVVSALSFGWLGDARTGADKFIGLAMPSSSYPEYLPSGVLWVYMYAVTPIMNLLHTINTDCGCQSVFFFNTLTPLLPSFLRTILIPVDQIEKGSVISEAFNVSTAFVDPFVDNGYIGIWIFTLFISTSTIFYWQKKSVRDLLIFSVLLQSLILTIFYNHFFSLPVIAQIPWFYILFRKKFK